LVEVEAFIRRGQEMKQVLEAGMDVRFDGERPGEGV
jgi:hypothetical protein